MMKLGSLFDGSGGFPLAGALCGIAPAWAAEVEPYPIAVTRSRFPSVKHLGDVSKVDGAKIEPVDIITFGSPCQDLSVAGKRAGLKHEGNGDEETTRSGLFMEAVRIIKEMRVESGGRYPTLALWENVPGAFSSNKGEDFRIVLQELIQIIEPGAVMPAVPKSGWPYADHYCGDGWSLAYRVLDAQFWGVPQRRRRIFLVVDFAGQCAGEILFKRKSLRGYFETSRAEREGTAADAEGCVGADDPSGIVLDDQGGSQISIRADGMCPTLRAEMHGNVPAVLYPQVLPFDTTQITSPQNGNKPEWGDPCHPLTAQAHAPAAVLKCAAFKVGQGEKARGIGWQNEKCPTLASEAGGNSVPSVCIKTWDARGNGDGETVNTITGDHENRATDYTSLVVGTFQNTGQGWWNQSPVAGTLRTPVGGDALLANVIAAIPIHDQATRFAGKRGDKFDGKGNGLGVGEVGAPSMTLTSADRHSVCYAETYQKCTGPLMANSHPGSYSGQDAYTDMLVVGKETAAGVDCRNLTELTELYPTLQAKPNGGQSLNYSGAVRIRYIVRRLTPTECARLQGFPDFWGHPDRKEDFTDEEYRFWLDVRNTHAEINGKQVKEHTKPQMLTWYNKLHTDSAEYKMWGNGIALPCATYVMQGIAEVLMSRLKDELNMGYRRYTCGYPEWEKNERPCDNPNECVECEDCGYALEENEE